MAEGPAGCPHFGRIKSFNAIKGFGFVQSSISEKDIIFGRNNLPEPLRKSDLAGVQVSFDAYPDSKGLRISKLHFSEDVEKLARSLPSANGCGRIHGVTNSIFGNGDKGHMGQVKSCNLNKGFGFIVSPEFPVDVMFSTKELPPFITPEPGMPCTFTSTLTPDGKYKATYVEFEVPGVDSAVTLAGTIGLQGVIKSYNGTYGFITGTSMPVDNVYFKPCDLAALTQEQCFQGNPVTFDLIYHKDGKPQARNICPGALPQNYTIQKRTASEAFGGGEGMKSVFDFGELASKRVALSMPGTQGDVQLISGFISHYRGSPDGTRKGGFGFIKCLDVGSDIRFSQSCLPPNMQMMDAQSLIGMAVQFKPSYNSDGRMSAEYLVC
eukprot:TRINITY_DN3442_c0_g1_i1.p1 TRINITY_DN3442_c0_g1~~TRINITY_DN3442_c0_g1_i1.p1  ORF type:complete len:396 (-),score=49.05 TRINITY_DN3442_c0_g1_i1:77-1216(-)